MLHHGNMRFSEEKIRQIKSIMKNQFDKEVTDEEAQMIGMATLQFVIAKAQDKPIILNLTEEVYGE